MPNPIFDEYISSYTSKESIENNLKKLFGENYDIDLERDNEYIENNMFKFDEQVGKYELMPTGNLVSIYYIINTIKKEKETYTVNVLESVITSDYSLKYRENEGEYSLIETFKDYDRTKALIDDGKEIFHLKGEEIYSVLDGKSVLKFDMLKGEVLKRKNEFLAYNITIKRAENGNFIVQKIESADVNN